MTSACERGQSRNDFLLNPNALTEHSPKTFWNSAPKTYATPDLSANSRSCLNHSPELAFLRSDLFRRGLMWYRTADRHVLGSDDMGACLFCWLRGAVVLHHFVVSEGRR